MVSVSRAGSSSSPCLVEVGFETANKLHKSGLAYKNELAEVQKNTQGEIGGVLSPTSNMPNRDQVYEQKERLA